MGETATSNFYDFGISGRVPEPQNQLFLSLDTQRYLEKSRKSIINFNKYYFVTLKTLEIHA